MYCPINLDSKETCIPSNFGGGASMVAQQASMNIRPVATSLQPQGFTSLSSSMPGTDQASLGKIATAMGIDPNYATGNWSVYDPVFGTVSVFQAFTEGSNTRQATGIRPDGVYVQMSWNPYGIESKDGTTYYAMHVDVRTPYDGNNQFDLAKRIAKAWATGVSVYPKCSVDPDFASAMTRIPNPNEWNNTFVSTSQPGQPASSVMPGKNMAWYSYLHEGNTNDIPAIGACYCTTPNCTDLPMHCTAYTNPQIGVPGACTACEPGYAVEKQLGQCMPCPSNCISCSTPSTCAKCDAGYYTVTDPKSLNRGTCAACPTNCTTCTTTHNQPSCLTCKSPATLHSVTANGVTYSTCAVNPPGT